MALAGVSVPPTINGIGQQPIEGVSLADCIERASTPSPKAVQYFEIHGNRGVWRDGWKAVTFHVPNTPFADDQWELYHLDNDVGECHDLADRHPNCCAISSRRGGTRRASTASSRSTIESSSGSW